MPFFTRDPPSFRWRWVLSALFFVLGVAADGHSAETTAPNIVFILADDFGYGDAPCYNPAAKMPMPAIDRLATEGMKFTDSHSGSSVCTPTRYGVLTGRYAWRTHLQKGVFYSYDKPLIDAKRLTVPGLLKQYGYHTACIGKWHLGWDWPMPPDAKPSDVPDFTKPIGSGPIARGFDVYFGTNVPNQAPYIFIEQDRTVGQPTAQIERNEVINLGRGGPGLPGWKFEDILPTITARAVGYIDERATAKEPFFLYFSLTTPHEPISPSKGFQGKSGVNPVADLMMETDWAVGEVLAALDRNKLAGDTLVIFTTDNGHATYTGLPGLLAAGHKPSGPLRGYKTDIYEGGHRVPFVARWPARIRSKSQCDATICHTMLLATCAELVGAKLPDGAGEDSASILPLLQGKTPNKPVFDAVVHHSLVGHFAIRRGRWKLVFFLDAENGTQRPELYDLVADLGETKNVADHHPSVVAELTRIMERIVADGRSTPGTQQSNDVAIDLWKPVKLK